MKLRLLLLTLISFYFFQSSGQTTFPTNGVADPQHNYWAFTNAVIYVQYDQKITNGTLIVKDGKVFAVGKNIEIPKDAVIIDLKGKYIYPSFIDLYGDYGMPKVPKPTQTGRSVQLESSHKEAKYWNEHIHPETKAVELFKYDDKTATELRSAGIGAVLTHYPDGIIRGTSALILTSEDKPNDLVVNGNVAMQIAFKRGVSNQSYPTSLMGIIALIRQSMYDAIWYQNQETVEKEFNVSLESLVITQDLPQIIEAGSANSILRAAKLGDEFQRNMIIKATPDAYLYAKEIKNAGFPIILPVNFPKAVDVSAPYDDLNINLGDLKNWETAPAGAKILADNKVNFAFTAYGLKTKSDYLKAIRNMKQYGLSEKQLLYALTTAPAQMIGQEDLIGDLNEGKIANFIITSNNIFNTGEVILENWIMGKKYIVNPDEIDIRGNYNLSINKERFQLIIEGKRYQPKAVVPMKNEKVKVNLSYSGRQIEFNFTVDDKTSSETYRLSGVINDDESRIWAGKAMQNNGEWVEWAAIRQSDFAEAPKLDSSKIKIKPIPSRWYPNMAYGFDSLPKPEIIIFQNATIWTNEDTGILVNSDIAIANGKILAIGKSLTQVGLFGTKDVNVKTVNAKGKFITCGIIDEHSHIAIDKGVNEAGWNNSAEVRIGDVIRPDDINIYRQLSGGVTASQLLHGSANPIGGQSALIKLRWGRTAEEMKIKGADGFIKFALGENVKQSNWGDNRKTRFPQSRMGVEQVYFDAFTRASEYRDTWTLHEKAMENKRKKDVVIAPRRDLRLEALSQILDTNRYITCHSYVQSEINMLMHVADSFNFKVNTFTHVLEGYKVADKIAEHGAAASTFSDWWAYKFEVNDAIPYNAAILNKEGVVTAINSDDAEMGRRLNQEAAKTMKYGGVSQEDAWKMVTLNPAMMLHLDNRMGSLKVGKDADIVIWSANPLSIIAKVEQTYIDGICYYDVNRDLELRKRIKAERIRIINKMLKAGDKNKDKTEKPGEKKEILYECDTIEIEIVE